MQSQLNWENFELVDSFNGDNKVSGKICHTNGDLYGALMINSINNKAAPQLILATPKIRYPFDKNGHWTFPQAKIVESYVKYDGTNIFAFQYLDADGKVFISYKTRLTPFLRDSKFGVFATMWRDILANQLDIEELVKKLQMNLSWELYGSRNPHLIKYDITLRAVLLFARDGQNIIPPSQLSIPPEICALKTKEITKNYIPEYQEVQKILDIKSQELEDGKYLGNEGEVWYWLDLDNRWGMLKCKGHIIEAIHWASGGLSKNIITSTCFTAFENYDDPTVNNIVDLLLEEFTQSEIDKIFYRIKGYLDDVRYEYQFKQRVLDEYHKLNINILTNKIDVLRALSTKFQKNQMERVFASIMENIN